MDLLKFWQIEQNSPKWFKDANSLWRESEKDFMEFCDRCYKIYDLHNAVLYVEKVDNIAEIHFGAERGAVIDIEQLKEIRDELLTEFDVVFGWVVKQNRGIKNVCEQVGLTYNGVQMFNGESRGQLLEWRCYAVSKNSFQTS